VRKGKRRKKTKGRGRHSVIRLGPNKPLLKRELIRSKKKKIANLGREQTTNTVTILVREEKKGQKV